MNFYPTFYIVFQLVLIVEFFSVLSKFLFSQ